jgi:hypothetical protein
VLDALNFELTQPTIKTFLRRCLRAAESDAKVGGGCAQVDCSLVTHSAQVESSVITHSAQVESSVVTHSAQVESSVVTHSLKAAWFLQPLNLTRDILVSNYP